MRIWKSGQRDLETQLLKAETPSEEMDICIERFQRIEPMLKEIFSSDLPDQDWTFQNVDNWLYDQVQECKRLGLSKDRVAWGHVWKCVNLIQDLYDDESLFQYYIEHTKKKELPFR